MNTIDFAIDLGTTNSLIAKSLSGEIEVYKNPIGHKETLPSVVAFRGDKILIGDKASEYLEKDPENVFGGFKRKMGTSETFFVKSLQAHKSPIELSTIILKELKTFVYTDKVIPSVVITIPASFDTVQSNATKKAGYEAGFKEVVLLQEPIAACLAFANKGDHKEKYGKWLVYDLGGGTFDVAIVDISNEELKVIDHKGDNYLGGLDFDNLLVEKVILNDLFQRDGFSNIQKQMENQSIEFKRLYQILLHKAEAAKKELSVMAKTEIEYSVVDDSGAEQDVIFTISRDAFNKCIYEKSFYTIDLINELLSRNQIATKDINQVVLVGGSTYIPLIRELIESKLSIKVNASVDPTTAVVIGAAQYAATKRGSVQEETEAESKSLEKASVALHVRTSYLKTSMDQEELLMASWEGPAANYFYRIFREDGGYDSGLKPATEKIREYITLAPGQLSRFYLKFYDDKNEAIETDAEPIEIIQGKFNINGQPLPNDICLEVDDMEDRSTKLELIFGKNSILPLKKTIYREVSKTIYKTSTDKLIVNILEGDRHAFPSTNQVIGMIEIDPSELSADLVKGSDLEIKLSISESRDISVNVYLSLTDQEFKNVFNPSERYVSIAKLEDEMNILLSKIKFDLREYERQEEFEVAAKLDGYLQEATIIRQGLDTISQTLNSDEKYHLEERKRKLAQKYDQLGKYGKLTKARTEYFEVKSNIVNALLDDALKAKYETQYKQLISTEPSYISSESIYVIEGKTKQLRVMQNEILFNSTDFIIRLYYNLAQKKREEFTDADKAKMFIEQGEKALERQNYAELKVVNLSLLHLLPEREERSILKNFKGTGIG